MSRPGAQTLATLPAPDPLAQAHSARLHARIADEIAAAGGSIGFDRFMDLALYAPGLGYYQAGQQRIGAGGDFTTAPESSPLFGRALARQIAALLDTLPAPGTVLEFGAGTGALAAALIPALAEHGARLERYQILEVSADLRAQQRARLCATAAIGAVVEWLDAVPAAPWQGVVIANEVLDALPVQRFVISRGGGCEELAVACEAGAFAWVRRAADRELSAAVAAIQARQRDPLPPGYVSEFCPLLGPWCATLAQFMDAGAVVLIDYGYRGVEYYHDERSAGTLQCHYRQRAHADPFRWVGLQDLSAAVDFSYLAQCASAAQFTVAGFCPQAQFLLGCGIEQDLAVVGTPGSMPYLAATAAVKRLLLPGEMGETFKVLGLTRGLAACPWPGFALLNHLARL